MEIGSKVKFTDKAVTERSKANVEVDIEGYIRGMKLVPTSTGVSKKFLVCDKMPQAYCTPNDYGWYNTKELTLIE